MLQVKINEDFACAVIVLSQSLKIIYLTGCFYCSFGYYITNGSSQYCLQINRLISNVFHSQRPTLGGSEATFDFNRLRNDRRHSSPIIQIFFTAGQITTPFSRVIYQRATGLNDCASSIYVIFNVM